MGAYHIWHPSWVRTDPPTLETFVTLGEAFDLSRGSSDVAAKIAHAVGLDDPPKTWSFIGSRSHYFTSYFEDAASWEDRWSLVWRTTITCGAARKVTSMPASGFIEVDLVDPTYSDDDSPDDWASWPCVIIADFRDRPALNKAMGLLSTDGIAGHTIATAFERYPQLRIDFGDRPRAWYEAGAKEAELFLEALRKAGASVRFNETTAWLGGG